MAKKDSAKAYLEGVLKSVPADKQEKVKALLADEDLLEVIGDGVMLKADYSRGYDALKASKLELDNWYNDNLTEMTSNAAAAERLAQLEKDGLIRKSKGKEKDDDDEDEDETSSAALKKLRGEVLTKDEAGKLLQTSLASTVQGMSAVQNAMLKLAMQHQMRFKEALDPQAILDHAAKVKAPTVEAAYQSLFAEKLQKWQEDSEAAASKKLRDDVRAEVIAEIKSQGPYPVGGVEESQDASGSALSGLKGKEDDFSADAAARDYERRVAARGANA
jgi:hypothetical protein